MNDLEKLAQTLTDIASEVHVTVDELEARWLHQEYRNAAPEHRNAILAKIERASRDPHWRSTYARIATEHMDPIRRSYEQDRLNGWSTD